MCTPRYCADTWRRYVEEVGELERTCDGLMDERNAMLVKLEGLKRRKQIETEVSAKHEAVAWNMQKKSKLAWAKKSGGGVEHSLRTVLLKLLIHVLHVRNGFFGKLKAIYSVVPCRGSTVSV